MYAIRSYYEVWVTNKSSDFTDSRNILAFQDLAEHDPNIYNQIPDFQENNGLPYPQNIYPNNDANGLYNQMSTTYSDTRHRITSYNVCYTKLLRILFCSVERLLFKSDAKVIAFLKTQNIFLKKSFIFRTVKTSAFLAKALFSSRIPVNQIILRAKSALIRNNFV